MYSSGMSSTADSMLMRMNRQRSPLSTLVLLAVLCVPHVFAKNSTQIVVVPVTNMFSGPSDQTDVVSQAVYGSNVTLLTARGEWSRIQTADQYKGWVPSRHLRLVQNGSGYATSGVIVQVESLFANLYREPDVTRHKPVLTIPFEVRLEVMTDVNDDAKEDERNGAKGKEAHEGWLQVRLPDKRSAWIQSTGGLPGVEGSMAKLFASEALTRQGGDFMDMLGPDGARSQGDPTAVAGGTAEWALRFALGATTYGGTSEIQRNIIAQRGLGLPRAR